jgi:hypothetical protein
MPAFVNKADVREAIYAKADIHTIFINRTEIKEAIYTKVDPFSSFTNRTDGIQQSIYTKADIVNFVYDEDASQLVKPEPPPPTATKGKKAIFSFLVWEP